MKKLYMQPKRDIRKTYALYWKYKKEKLSKVDVMSDRGEKWAGIYAETGDAYKALKEAGYKMGNKNSEYVKVCQLKQEYSELISKHIQKGLPAALPNAIRMLSNLAEHAESEAVRRQACSDIIRIAGLDIVRVQDVTDNRTDEQLLAAIANDMQSATQTTKDAMSKALSANNKQENNIIDIKANV